MPLPDEILTAEPFTDVMANNAALLQQAGLAEPSAGGPFPAGLAPAPDPSIATGLPDYLTNAGAYFPPPPDSALVLADKPAFLKTSDTKDKGEQGKKKKCSSCGAENAADALRCKRCKKVLIGHKARDKSNLGIEHQAVIYNTQGLNLATTGDDGLLWKVACKTGTLALSPGPGAVDIEQPLVLTRELFDDMVLSAQEQAFPYITVPETHANGALENTGYVRAYEVLDREGLLADGRLPDKHRAIIEGDPSDTQYLLAGIEFTEPDVKARAERGSIPDTSIGVKFNYRNKRTGQLYKAAWEHLALTPMPWVDGLVPFGLSQDNAVPGADDPSIEFDGVYVPMPDSNLSIQARVSSGDGYEWDLKGLNPSQVRTDAEAALSLVGNNGKVDLPCGVCVARYEKYWIVNDGYEKIAGIREDEAGALDLAMSTLRKRYEEQRGRNDKAQPVMPDSDPLPAWDDLESGEYSQQEPEPKRRRFGRRQKPDLELGISFDESLHPRIAGKFAKKYGKIEIRDPASIRRPGYTSSRHVYAQGGDHLGSVHTQPGRGTKPGTVHAMSAPKPDKPSVKIGGEHADIHAATAALAEHHMEQNLTEPSKEPAKSATDHIAEAKAEAAKSGRSVDDVLAEKMTGKGAPPAKDDDGKPVTKRTFVTHLEKGRTVRQDGVELVGVGKNDLRAGKSVPVQSAPKLSPSQKERQRQSDRENKKIAQQNLRMNRKANPDGAVIRTEKERQAASIERILQGRIRRNIQNGMLRAEAEKAAKKSMGLSQDGSPAEGLDLSVEDDVGLLPGEHRHEPREEDMPGITVEELLAQQQAELEASQARIAALEADLALSQGTISSQGEQLHTDAVTRRVRQLQAAGYDPALCLAVKNVMLADKTRITPDDEGMNLSVQASATGADGKTTTEERKLKSASDIVEYLLSAMPSTGTGNEATRMAGIHTELTTLHASAHESANDEDAKRAAVDALEKQRHPERFDADGKRI